MVQRGSQAAAFGDPIGPSQGEAMSASSDPGSRNVLTRNVNRRLSSHRSSWLHKHRLGLFRAAALVRRASFWDGEGKFSGGNKNCLDPWRRLESKNLVTRWRHWILWSSCNCDKPYNAVGDEVHGRSMYPS